MKAPPKRKGNRGISPYLADYRRALNESPSEKEGKYRIENVIIWDTAYALNESPSEKEGKYHERCLHANHRLRALNESPSEKEGKFSVAYMLNIPNKSLNESPSEKEGKSGHPARRILRR